MALFEWKNGTKTQNAIVTGDGVTVQDAQWEGETPISASNMNSAQEQLLTEAEKNINSNLGTETDTWSSSSSYEIGDKVIFDGGVYKNITGNNSSEPSVDTTNWQLLPIIDYNNINESLIAPKMKLLWTNPKPSQNFPAQKINLSNDDYDYLVVFFKLRAGLSGLKMTGTLKGYDLTLNGSDGSHLAGSSNYYGTAFVRNCTRVSNTQYNIPTSTSFMGNSTSSPSAGDLTAYLIPVKIYGGKF